MQIREYIFTDNLKHNLDDVILRSSENQVYILVHGKWYWKNGEEMYYRDINSDGFHSGVIYLRYRCENFNVRSFMVKSGQTQSIIKLVKV